MDILDGGVDIMSKSTMERNVRQLEVIFSLEGDLEKPSTSSVYSYVENFGRIVLCEESRNGLNFRIIEAEGVSMHWVNRCHEINGHRVFMRREMHILDLPLFCLKKICTLLLEMSIDYLCYVTEVCTTLKDAATLVFEENFSKSGIRIASKKQMQTDARILLCFRHSITRVEIEVKDKEHFSYILSSLKKMSPNVLKYLIFVNQCPSFSGNFSHPSQEHHTHFSHITKAELEDLLLVFSHLEGLSFNTKSMMLTRLPPNLRIFSIDYIYGLQRGRPLETSNTINANLQKIVIATTYVCSLFIIPELLQSSPQIKEITVDGWEWVTPDGTNKCYKIDDMVQHAPQLEVLSLYAINTCSTPTIAHIQALKKMHNLKILNISLALESVKLLNAINELNVVVECLCLHSLGWDHETSLSISNFKQLKFLRIDFFKSFEALPELLGRLTHLSLLVLKRYSITVESIKIIVGACSKLTDFHVGQLKELGQQLDTKQYLEIVSVVKGRSNELQLRIWVTKTFSLNIDSKVFCNHVKYVNVLLKPFKCKSYPPCGFTIELNERMY